MGKNKTSKYFKYAIGEIILLVLGILIALQINNWNEVRKIRKTEINTLKTLKITLKISGANLQQLVDNNLRWQSYNIKIRDYLENKKPYDESLDICFGTYFWSGKAQLTTTAYSQLKKEGLDLITNQNLREDIIYVFEDYFGQIKNEHEQWEKDYLSAILYPEHVQLFRKYFPDTTNVFYDEYAKPIDYDGLLNNQKFINIIAENISLRRYSMAFKINLISKIDSLNTSIDREISLLSN